MNLLQNVNQGEHMLFHKAAGLKQPLNGSIELLPLCNMNCDMCYVRLSKEEMETKGKLRTAGEWIEIAKQMKEAGVLFLLLTGGEPLLYAEFREVYLALKEMGMIITLNTNGTMIDEKWADFFGKNKPRRINVTLYGAEEATYKELCHYSDGFQKAIDGIHLLQEQGVEVKINANIVKANAKDVDSFFKIGKNLGVPVTINTYIIPSVREREKKFNWNARLLPEEAAWMKVYVRIREIGEAGFLKEARETLDMLRKSQNDVESPIPMKCLAGKCSFTVNWQGEMRPCVMLEKPGISVFDAGFQNAWKYVVAETEKIFLNAKCGACKLRLICQNCAACAFYEGGSFNSKPEYMCQYTHALYTTIKREAARISRDDKTI